MENRNGLADETIVRRVLDGEVEAYGMLVDRYGARLYGLAHHLSGDADTAADLAQDTLIAAYEHLDQLRDTGNFGAWAAGILRNKFRNLARSRSARAVSLDQMMESGFDPPDPASRPAGGRETPGEREEDRLEGAMQCVSALPDKFREPLMLRYVDDLSYREIGRFLGLRVTTVAMRLTYARRLLLKKAKEMGLL